MKKILALSIVALAALVGCTSPGDQLCLTSAECAGEEDPAAFCTDAKNDRSEDEQACADACKAEGDAFAQCYLDNGECKDEVFGDLDTFEACEAEATAAGECAEENC